MMVTVTQLISKITTRVTTTDIIRQVRLKLPSSSELIKTFFKSDRTFLMNYELTEKMIYYYF